MLFRFPFDEYVVFFEGPYHVCRVRSRLKGHPLNAPMQ
jgi:hypothetical protein